MKLKYGRILISLVCVCALTGCGGSSDTEEEMNSREEVTESIQSDTSEEVVLSKEDLQELCEEYVENRKTESSYKNGKWGYYDINQDGVDELILTAALGRLCIVQYQKGAWEVLYEENYSTLLEDGRIRYYELSGSPQQEQYIFYKLTDGEYRVEAAMNRMDTAEDEYSWIFGENDRYEMDKGSGLQKVSEEDWMDALYEYLGTSKAEFTVWSMAGEEGTAYDFKTEEEAYQAFLKGECGFVLSDSYRSDIQYVEPCLKEGEEYTLYDILNLLNNEPWRYEADNDWGIGRNNYGTELEYALIDCGQDGRKEFALKISKPGVDGFEGIYIIQYRNDRLYLCYGIDQWSRRHVTMNQYGYIWEDGSGGAMLHFGMDIWIDAEGVSHTVQECIIQFDRYDFTNYFDGVYPAADILDEAVTAWIEAYDSNGSHPLEGLSIQMTVVDDKDYYTYDNSADIVNAENVESLIQRCEAAGVTFSSYSEVAAAIQKKQEVLGVGTAAEDKNAVVWTEAGFPGNE